MPRTNLPKAICFLVAIILLGSACQNSKRGPREGTYAIEYEGIDCSDPKIRWGEKEIDCQAFVALYNAFDGKTWYGTNMLDLRNNSDFRLNLSPALGIGGVIPEEVDQLQNLNRFVLSGVRIDGFPQGLFDLEIKWMTFRHNGLESLPPEMGRMPELLDLIVNNNALQSVPAELFRWKHIDLLDLARNQLREIPAEIGNLRSLTRIELANNRLGSVPAELGQLKKMRSLNLSNNQLEEVPKEISEMESLTHLDLSGNPIMTVPEEIWNMTSLKSLDLSRTKLTSFPEKVSPRITIRLLEVDIDIPAHIRPDRVVQERRRYKTWNEREIEAHQATWTVKRATVLDLLSTDSFINDQPCINVKMRYERDGQPYEIFSMICTNPVHHRLMQPGQEIEILIDPNGERRPIIFRSGGQIVK